MCDCKRVSYKSTQIARNRAAKIINDIRKNLKAKYKFQNRMIGSGKYRTIMKDKNGVYDLDYQLILSHR